MGQAQRLSVRDRPPKMLDSNHSPASVMNIPQPKTLPNLRQPKAGFNRFAELLNGRAAMVGFAALIVIEIFTGSGLLTLLGLR
jgi:Chlorophyll A-B binding protein